MLDINEIQNYKIFENEKILKLELLKKQGLCNKNYKLQTKKDTYLLRQLNINLGINRKNEFKNQNLAYEKHLSGKAIYYDENNALMLCEYLQGNHKSLLNKKDLLNLSSALFSLHEILYEEKEINLTELFNDYDLSFFNKKISLELKNVFKNLKSYEKELVFSHNDLNPGNIFFNKGVKFLDWEYSCVNDKYFDLVNIIIEFSLKKSDEKIFLFSYFKEKEINYKKLKDFKIIYLSLSLLWFHKQKEYLKRDDFLKKLENCIKYHL